MNMPSPYSWKWPVWVFQLWLIIYLVFAMFLVIGTEGYVFDLVGWERGILLLLAGAVLIPLTGVFYDYFSYGNGRNRLIRAKNAISSIRAIEKYK